MSTSSTMVTSKVGKSPTTLPDARQVSEPGDGDATSPAVTAVNGERVRDDAARPQSLVEIALGNPKSSSASSPELALGQQAQQANYERQQANYARFMENVGRFAVSNAISLSPQPSAYMAGSSVDLIISQPSCGVCKMVTTVS